MRNITKDITLTIDGSPLGFRLTKPDAFSGVEILRLLLRLQDQWGEAEQGDGPARSANAEPQDCPRRSGTHTPVVCTTLKYQLIIVCYGPACEEYALRIRHMLYLDGSGFPRRILRDAGIFPVPDPPQPSLLHEEEGSLWRKRADLTISLRIQYETQAQSRGAIQSAPAVRIIQNSELRIQN